MVNRTSSGGTRAGRRSRAVSRPKHRSAAPGAEPTKRPSFDERYAAGRALRDRVPRKSHGGWEPPRGRRDPIDLLIESSQGRVAELIPIRYNRMLQSPFAFYRGAAAIMAADLAKTPATGVRVQSCGDCHLMNFGGFATPERRIILDINDFDETLPAPWEWDVKRLAASFVIAGQNNRFSPRECRAAGATAVRAYREHMGECARMPALEAWYSSLDLIEVVEGLKDPQMRKLYRQVLRKEGRRDASQEFPKLAHFVGKRPRIKDDPPLIYHWTQHKGAEFDRLAKGILGRYRESLAEDRRVLLDRFTFADFAVKVVGVGSVGTLCGIALLLAGDDDPLFLQIKEARGSVLEPYAGKSVHENHGQRVVSGQRLMQAASDVFLGWTHGDLGRHYYMRQLRDVKVKPVVEIMSAQNLVNYARLCGWILARAHSRSGDAAVLVGYMGQKDTFDDAVVDFSVAYAAQNERDHSALKDAVRAGRIQVRNEA